jgi:hypothetical protein
MSSMSCGSSSWRVLEIGILDDHQVAGDDLEPAPQGGALALVPRLLQQPEAELGLERRQAGRGYRRWNSRPRPPARCRIGTRSTRRMTSSTVASSLKTGITTEQQRVLQLAAQPCHQCDPGAAASRAF